MGNQKEIEKVIAKVLHKQMGTGEAVRTIKSLLQDEKKKWKEEVMKAIGEDEVMPTIIETPETEFLIKKIPAHIGRNEFRQQLRVKLNKV